MCAWRSVRRFCTSHNIIDKAAEVDLACYEDSEFYDKYMQAVNETAAIAQKVLTSIGNWFKNILTIFTATLLTAEHKCSSNSSPYGMSASKLSLVS
ncbi:MAG: hypothetical protein IJ428_02300 [Clostridia bacterium]|nr:hypothetical protein [Clostridia bacterium]